MKKNSINTAVLASLAGIAGIANISSAVNINPDGTGQVLVYPYYSVNAGNQTLLSVVNTTNRGKAVKVRILEGRNSFEVLDFNLFLSPQDVWTAGIVNLGLAGASSPASILTTDTSCTAPNFASDGTSTTSGLPYVNFRNFLYLNDTVGGTGLERTREGHIEMIEMATLFGDLQDGITHVPGTDTPDDCGVLGNGRLGSEEIIAANLGEPTGGLFGGAAVINIANGTYTNYSATALDAFWGPGVGSAYTDPDSVTPSLSDAGNIAGSTSLVFSNGRIISSTWGTANVGSTNSIGQRIDSVSAVFMADTFFNEYSTLASNNEASEWVITFPTKRFYVNGLPSTTGTPLPPPQSFGAPGALPPFTNRYTGQACDPIGITSWNREEFAGQAGPVPFSPPAPGQAGPALCFETNVLTFNQTITNATNGTSSPSKIFGSVHARNINTPRISSAAGNNTQAGWTRISLSGRQLRQSIEGHRFVGLPVTGFWAISIENNNATPGVKGFYGGAYNHRNSRSCVNVTPGAVSCFAN